MNQGCKYTYFKWRATAIKDVYIKTITNSKLQEELPEVKRLKKELKETQLELEIFKKAVHIFSNSDRKSFNLQLNINVIIPLKRCVQY